MGRKLSRLSQVVTSLYLATHYYHESCLVHLHVKQAVEHVVIVRVAWDLALCKLISCRAENRSIAMSKGHPVVHLINSGQRVHRKNGMQILAWDPSSIYMQV